MLTSIRTNTIINLIDNTSFLFYVRDSNTTIVGDFNSPFITVDRRSRQKFNKETQALNDALDLDGLNSFTEYSIQKQQNTHSSQVHMDRFLG